MPLSKTMISLGEAITSLIERFPDYRPARVVRYGTRYIFDMKPKDGSESFIGLFCVDRTTGRISGFNPLGESDPAAYFKAAKKNRVKLQ